MSFSILPLLQAAPATDAPVGATASGWRGVLDALKGSFSEFGDGIVAFLPSVVSALVFFIIGWIIAKIIRKIVQRGLRSIGLDAAVTKAGLDKMLNKIKPNLSAASVLGNVVYWLMMLMVITVTANILQVTMVNDAIAGFFGYLPTLTVAILMFIIGVYIADLVKEIVYTAANTIGLSGAKSISNIVYYVLFIFIAITALNQAGVDTSIISSNLTLILGAILLAFATAYALGSWRIVRNMLSSFYSKGKYQQGMRIRIGEHEGVIEDIDSISVTIRTSQGRVVLPANRLVEEEVIVLD